MPLDQLLQASLPAQLEESKPVSPTLMIGLGGTGKEILLRLRRRIVERYGSLSKLPFLQFMHLDTDTTATAKEQYDLRGSDDPLHPEVQFKPIERIDLTIEGGTGKYIDHIQAYPQIKRWFSTGGKIAKLGNLGEGAGQIRMASRLGLFHPPNFSRIASRLEQCGGLLRDASILQRTAQLGFDFNPEGMNIFIVASLAGGTGSGTFLDVAFLVQRYFPSADRVGILLLPAFFSAYAGSERVRANGYAALMELNHYTFGHPFLADWGGGRAETLQPPPFSATYLIDGVNEAGLVIGSSGKENDAYRMVAEILFQDYSIGSFAGTKRATRVNLVNFNLNVYTHNFLHDALRRERDDHHKYIVGDTYPTRFGSFGLATIAFPTDRVQSACACRLAVRILELWQKTLLEDPLEPLFVDFLSHERVRFAQGRYERRDGGGVIERRDIEDALLTYDSGGGKTFPSFLWQKAQTARTDLEAAPYGEKASRLAELRNEMERFLAREDSENPEEWGVGVRQLETNLRTLLERVKRSIEERAAELSAEPLLGVAYTLSLLRELKSLLRNENFWYLRHFEEAIPAWRDAVQLHGQALDQLQLDIGRHEKRLLFRADDLQRDLDKLVGPEDAEDLGVFYNHYLARVRKQVAKRGRQVCEAIDRFLGADDPTGDGLLGRYYSLLVGFEKLKAHLLAKESYFSKPERSELILSLFRDGDIDRWYQTWIGAQPEEADTLRLIGNQILTEIFQVASVTAALAYVQRTPSDEVEARILEHCRKHVASRERQPAALALLTDASRISLAERGEMVRQAYRLSKVWLAKGERGLEHTGLPPVSSDQRPCLIGVDVSNLQGLKELKDLVYKNQTPGDSTPSFLNIGERNRGMIVFYNELAGVPVFYPSSVTAPRGLHAAYDLHPEKEELHTDKNRFQFGELIPKRPDEIRRYTDSLRAFVLARLLGLLRVREAAGEADQPTFEYSYLRKEDTFYDSVFLGDELHSVDFLYRDARSEHLTDRRRLLQMVEETLQVLRKQNMLWVYSLLLELYLKKVYPPKEGIELKETNQTATQISPAWAVLDVARLQLSQMIRSGAELERYEQALAAKRGKRLEEELAYEEFKAALEPYCKPAGKFEGPNEEAMAHRETVWLEIWALDLSKVDKTREKEPAPLPVAPAPQAAVPPEKTHGERPCPSCRRPIDRRAIFCVHCEKTVAQHVRCPHCQEPRVPGDLDLCWKCGLKMREDERMECPRCFNFHGFPEDFPCPVCGFDPQHPEEERTVVREVPGGGGVQESNGTRPRFDLGEAATSPPGDPTWEQPAELVQCPNCYSMVNTGPRCSICSGLLEMN